MRLGRVFERRHSAVVGVRASTGWHSGFVIGAAGEVVLGGAPPGPNGLRFDVRLASGERVRARLLSRHPRWGLAVARIEGRSTVPLPVGPRGGLRPERWTLVLAVDGDGAPEPFAGLVVSTPRRRRPWAVVMAPRSLGSAVLDTRGRLIGVVVAGGRRRHARVVPFRRLLAFLRRSVLEAEPR